GLLGACLLAQPDRRHLAQPALDLPAKSRMRLHAVDDDGRVGAFGGSVEVDARATWQLAELDGLHARPYRRPDACFGDAVLCEHVALSFDSGSAMAAHRRHDERLTSELAHDV